eukprot:132942-Hanusia_phi.AAC.1
MITQPGRTYWKCGRRPGPRPGRADRVTADRDSPGRESRPAVGSETRGRRSRHRDRVGVPARGRHRVPGVTIGSVGLADSRPSGWQLGPGRARGPGVLRRGLRCLPVRSE